MKTSTLWKNIFVAAVVTVLSNCSDHNNEQTHSIARQWNEVLLEAIRSDAARPTVHARNLFHISAASYDSWTVFSDKEVPYLLGNTIGGFSCAFDSSQFPLDNTNFQSKEIRKEEVRKEAISYANFRLIEHRFKDSSGASSIQQSAEEQMEAHDYDVEFVSTDFSQGSGAALGNYIAECYINLGLQDGSNEVNGYANVSYSPVNTLPLAPVLPGNPDIVDLNHWQVLSIEGAIGQSGLAVSSEQPFLGPEWGQVYPFALSDSDKTTYTRDGFDYQVYFDPGAPPSIETEFEEYKSIFAMVSIWSSHLDAGNPKTIDISPASLGNFPIENLPTNELNYNDYYNTSEGGDRSPGHALNPTTGKAYPEQIVKQGDYARVLAEFWADGPDSETPPGHWFVLLNQVNDHPLLERKLEGVGRELEVLEWDIKAYFTLGGAMHDSAIAAWGIKGWYDFIRPVSAIRAMADFGQSTDSLLVNSYHVNGLPLVEGYIEVVETGDPLAGVGDVNVDKIKVLAWRGPDYISNPTTDQAGVGWILAENWWPYQRPTFVTPPFAGYVSGHSTFSRAAAEVLTALTGSEFFPGGMGEFVIKKNEFLVFEEGPSEDMTLQWATYQDASDQCSLSRIWGGIHPPADDLPGRLIGEKIGKNAFAYAMTYFD